MKIGISQIKVIGLVLMFATSLMAGGCSTKAKSEDMSATLTQRAEAAADRAEQASMKAEAAADRADQAATKADEAANRAESMADKSERIFQHKMKK